MVLNSFFGYLRLRLKDIGKFLALVALLFVLGSCSGPAQTDSPTSDEPSGAATPRPSIQQVEPPSLLQRLEPWLENYAPQVQINHPKPDQVFENTTINVRLQVQDLPTYKDKLWNMGPHLELILDNQPYSSIYDLEQPIVLQDLAPGSHTIRVFAERPWHESFKNLGAYAQTTFHIFAKTDENTPGEDQPLLTYGSPKGVYGAEPVLLDFYLTDAPLHQVAQDNPRISDWQIRYTINGDSFTLNTWEPIYVDGLKPGQNWVQLTLVDEFGNPIEGVFNNSVRLIEYDPNFNDTLAKLIKGELTFEQVGGIVDPTYEPPIPEPLVPEPSEIQESDSQESDSQETETSESETPESATPESEPSESETQNINERDRTKAKSDIEDIDAGSPEVIAPEPRESEAIGSESTDISGNSSDTILSKDVSDDDTADAQVIDQPTVNSKALESEPSVEQKAAPSAADSVETLEDSVSNTDILPETATNLSPDLPSNLEPTSTTTSTNLTPTNHEGPVDDNQDDNDPQVDDQADSSTQRKYFQRLYDYRDRSIETYGR